MAETKTSVQWAHRTDIENHWTRRTPLPRQLHREYDTHIYSGTIVYSLGNSTAEQIFPHRAALSVWTAVILREGATAYSIPPSVLKWQLRWLWESTSSDRADPLPNLYSNKSALHCDQQTLRRFLKRWGKKTEPAKTRSWLSCIYLIIAPNCSRARGEHFIMCDQLLEPPGGETGCRRVTSIATSFHSYN